MRFYRDGSTCDHLTIETLQTIHNVVPIKLSQRAGTRESAQTVTQLRHIVQLANGRCERRRIERAWNTGHLITGGKVSEIAVRIEHYGAPGGAVFTEFSRPAPKIICRMRKWTHKGIARWQEPGIIVPRQIAEESST